MVLNRRERLIADQEAAGSSPAVCLNHQRVGESGRPCLPWKQEIGGSNPPALTICPRCSAIAPECGVELRSNGMVHKRMVGRAARQRGANASRPSGRAGSTPAPSAIIAGAQPCRRHAFSMTPRPCARGGHSSVAEPLSTKQTTRVRFSLPAPIVPRSSKWPGHRSFKSETRVRLPHVAPTHCPFA